MKLFGRQRNEQAAAEDAGGPKPLHPLHGAPDYFGDALAVWGKDVSFIGDSAFAEAYRAGMESGHKLSSDPADPDLHIEWRVYVACWAASHARRLPGDFVECGVNTGIMSLAICRYIDFNSTGKTFFLFDTFAGIPEEQMLDTERGDRTDLNRYYEDCYEVARRNFAPFPRVRLVRGRVPDTLPGAGVERVAYLSLDMNIAAPELAAIEFFWDKLVTGAVVLLDDYGWLAHWPQKATMDRFAARHGAMILNMPTGQGLLIKS